jgi:hypothetical protein
MPIRMRCLHSPAAGSGAVGQDLIFAAAGRKPQADGRAQVLYSRGGLGSDALVFGRIEDLEDRLA